MKEIDKIDIVPLNKKDIFYRILSDVKKRPKNYRSSRKKVSHFHPEEQDNMITDVAQYKPTTNILNESNLYTLDTKYVCQPIEKTTNILVYNVKDKKVYTHKFQSNVFVSEIPTSCAWINYNNNLYISGGEINGKISKKELYNGLSGRIKSDTLESDIDSIFKNLDMILKLTSSIYYLKFPTVKNIIQCVSMIMIIFILLVA